MSPTAVLWGGVLTFKQLSEFNLLQCFKTCPWAMVSLQWYQMALSFALVNECTCVFTCAHTRALLLCVCVFLLFSLFRPPCRHNPGIYEITRAHLCSGGSHLGSDEASAGNHLGSTQSSFHSTSLVLSTLRPKLFTSKEARTLNCVSVSLWNSSRFRSSSTARGWRRHFLHTQKQHWLQ